MLIGVITVLALFLVNGGTSVANFQKNGEGRDLFSLIMSIVGIIAAVALLVNVAAQP